MNNNNVHLNIDTVFIKIFTALLDDVCCDSKNAANAIVKISSDFLTGTDQNAVVEFQRFYFSLQSEMETQKSDVNRHVDNLVESLQAKLAAGEDISAESISKDQDDENASIARRTLAGLQKQLETIISLNSGIREKLVPVLASVQFEDAIHQRVVEVAADVQAAVRSLDTAGQFNNSQAAVLQTLAKKVQASFAQCIQNSEAIVLKISDIVAELMTDAERVSKMSGETLQLLNNVREKLQKVFNTQDKGVASQQLVQALQSLTSHSLDLQSTFMPIIEALQFQDRIRQKLQNANYTLDRWIVHRNKNLAQGKDSSQADSIIQDTLRLFGEEISAKMTTPEERVHVRKYIAGLPEEKIQQDNLTYF